MVYLMNSLQVKSGSELIFPMMFGHLSFTTHRTWEVNMALPYAKALACWEKEFHGELKALRQKNSPLALKLGFLMPSHLKTCPQAASLPDGWLVQRRVVEISANQQSAEDVAAAESGETAEFVFVSPRGDRFTSISQALQHANKHGLLKQLRSHSAANFDSASSTEIQLTSNWQDYTHRGTDDIFADLPAYLYNMWVYSANKMSDRNPFFNKFIEVPFDDSYRARALKLQRLSLIPRIPQISGIAIPSPDVDPHKNALIKLLLFKPVSAVVDNFGHGTAMDEQGNEIDPYKALFPTAQVSGGNPYHVFLQSWEAYWKGSVLPLASAAENKINKLKEWPTIWETLEINAKLFILTEQEGCHAQMSIAEVLTMASSAHARPKLRAWMQDKLTLKEYCALLTKKFAMNLDAFARAKSSPKTQSYSQDADVASDPHIHHVDGQDAEFDPSAQDEGCEPDDEIRLKPVEAPSQVYHMLTPEGRAQVLTFHRAKTSRFVRDMLDAGLLPLTGTTSTLQENCTTNLGGSCKAPTTQLSESRQIAAALPHVSPEMLNLQRDAFEAKSEPAPLPADVAHIRPNSPHTAADISAHWEILQKPSQRMAVAVRNFEQSEDGFLLADEQRALCMWFGRSLHRN